MKTSDILYMSQEISNNLIKQWVLDKECIKDCYRCNHLNKETKECNISLKNKKYES